MLSAGVPKLVKGTVLGTVDESLVCSSHIAGTKHTSSTTFLRIIVKYEYSRVRNISINDRNDLEEVILLPYLPIYNILEFLVPVCPNW